MCHICKTASVRSEGDGRLHTGRNSTTYCNFFQTSWETTTETKEEFVASLTRPNDLALWESFHNSLILNDPLHVVYRGFAPSFVSSALLLLVESKFFGNGVLQQQYDAAYDAATQFIKRSGLETLSLEEFTRSSIGLEDGYPEMNTKGADIKSLIFWVAHVSRLAQQREPSSDLWKVLDLAAYSLASWVKALDASGLFMSRQHASVASAAGDRFLKCFQWLGHWSYIHRKLLFKVRPKAHLFQHYCKGPWSMVNTRFNPKSYSCWADEDFVRRVCAVANGCGQLGIRKSMTTRYLAAATGSWLGLS